MNEVLVSTDTELTYLANVAARITDDVAEQTWLVTMCVAAGHDADWLEAKAGALLHSLPSPLGIFGDVDLPAIEDEP